MRRGEGANQEEFAGTADYACLYLMHGMQENLAESQVFYMNICHINKYSRHPHASRSLL